MKVKHRNYLLGIAGIVVMAVYCSSYFYYRNQHALVHFRTYSGEGVEHRIDAVLPDGRLIFFGVIGMGKDSAETIELLHRTENYFYTRRKIHNIIYFPLRKTEVVYWSVVDREL